MSRDWTQQEFGITGKEPDAYEQLKSELAKVKKQLAIAVEALETYAQDKDCWEDVREECKLILKQIKELEK